MAQEQINLGSVYMDLRVKSDQVAGDIQKATGQLQNFDKATQGVSNSGSKLGGVFSNIGKGLLGGFGIGAGILGIQAATTALIGAFTGTVTAFTKFETQLGNIGTVLGKSKDEVGDLADGIKELAKNSPTSVDDLGAATYDILSAGITETADAMNVLTASQKLAVAGLGTTKQAVDIMTSAINAYGISADQADAVSNIFYNSVNFGKTTVEGLAQGFGGMVPIVAQAGVTFEEVGAAVGALTASGLSASEVYTGLEAASSALLKPNEDMIKVFDKLGVQTGIELVKKFGGLKGAYEEITKTSKVLGLTVAEVTGRKEAQSTVTALLTTASKAYDDQLANNVEGSNAIDKAYQTQLETTQNLVNVLKNRLQVVMINIGGKVVPYLLKALNFVIDLFGELYQYGRIVYSGFSFVAKGVAALVESITGGAKLLFKDTVNNAVGLINGLLGGLRKLGNKVTDALGLGEIPEFKIDFKFDTSNDAAELFGTLDALGEGVEKDVQRVGDAMSQLSSSKNSERINTLADSFGKLKEQVASVDDEFVRAKKPTTKSEAEREAEAQQKEALKDYADLSSALEGAIQDRLKFFATQEQNQVRLSDLIKDSKIDVQDLGAAWREAIGDVNKQYTDLQANHKKVNDQIQTIKDSVTEYKNTTESSNEIVVASYEDVLKQLEKTQSKIQSIITDLASIDDQTKKNAESFEQDVVQTIVDAEQKISQLRNDLQKELAGGDPNTDRVSDLQKEINAQQAILDYAHQQNLGNEAELAEERKKRSFNALQLLQYEFQQEQAALQERKVKLQAELDEQLKILESVRVQEAQLYEDTKNAIIKLEEEISIAYQENLNTRLAATTDFVNKADEEYKRLATIVQQSLALQSAKIGLPGTAIPTSTVGNPTVTSSAGAITAGNQNININAQVNNPTDWSQVGTQLGWQLRGGTP